MAIAFSESDYPLIDVSIDGTTAAAILAGLHSGLSAAGWPSAAITNGYKYTLTSQQSLQCVVTIVNDGTSVGGRACVKVQFFNVAEDQFSLVMPLMVGSGRAFQLVANPWQLFVCILGFTNETQDGVFGHSLAGGIPWVDPAELDVAADPDCAIPDDPDITTEIWWCCCDDNFSRANFRNALTVANAGWNAYRNGELVPDVGGTRARLRIFPVRHAGSPLAPQTMKLNGYALALDPLIGWGDAAGNEARVRGQVYDALLASFDQPLDDLIGTSEPDESGSPVTVNWRGYGHDSDAGAPGTYYGTLYLCLGKPAAEDIESNYVY